MGPETGRCSEVGGLEESDGVLRDDLRRFVEKLRFRDGYGVRFKIHSATRLEMTYILDVNGVKGIPMARRPPRSRN